MRLFAWFRALFGRPARSVPQGVQERPIPEGWTDDMSIAIPGGQTVGQLVDRTLALLLSGAPRRDAVGALVAEFGLPEADAELAVDRTLGGVVRAATRNEANRPDRTKDPVAWESFQRAASDRSIIARLRPEYADEPGTE